MAALFVVALAWQMRSRRYVPWIYWLTVVLVSVVGTQITDILTDKLDVSLYASTGVFAVALAVVFAALVRARAHAVHPLHRDPPARGVLLARHPVHLRARHRGGRPRHGGVQARLISASLIFGTIIAVSAPACSSRRERRAGLLARLHRDAAARRLARRPPLAGREYGGLGFGTSLTSLVFLSVIVALVGVLSFGTPRRRTAESVPVT